MSNNRILRILAILAILALPGAAVAGWDGSGTFTRTNGVFTGANVWVNDRDAGVKIRADRQDTHDQDLATGINNTLTKDGQNTPTANLPMGGFRHTGPGAATARDQYGRVAETRDGARGLMQAVVPDEATDTLASWIAWLRGHAKANGKIGTIGWCFGGGWSLNASIAAPVDATVVYYGRVNRSAADLKALKGPVLGHFATRDKWIDGKMVGGFEKAMAEAGKSATSHWYEADHAFANPTGARYDEADAQLAWRRTLAFFAANL